MGICLSCLRPRDAYVDEYNETSSLLRNQHNLYSNDYLQEEELLKQQRQQELNTIVNELSDNLIDVSSFLNNTSNNSVTNTPNFYPYEYNTTEKLKVLNDVEELTAAVKDSCKISFNEPLYLKF
ncbi:predicted protein [Scheffersomyces stipitis CBS 6054]|uniref:Uncharacterized protein n=1 Tax=Scheffersomyces stipitis (strain ATCC 58785 / CBS 6054 / NBRC 10063 / NRRL Y-11545) TaxID=322104 RepID=A3LMS5_PICST|nr:predicted protein [Scheffersomyces stipitis CBS 6054]ABN64738.2 predicted protein [Scheffersomyces stipitis CBS 6054]